MASKAALIASSLFRVAPSGLQGLPLHIIQASAMPSSPFHWLRSAISSSWQGAGIADGLRLLRTTASASESISSASDEIQIVVMPKLSHQMQSGRLVKWHKRAGDRVAMYDILCEVETEELVESVFKVRSPLLQLRPRSCGTAIAWKLTARCIAGGAQPECSVPHANPMQTPCLSCISEPVSRLHAPCALTQVGDFAGTVSLLVESQEEGFIAQILVGVHSIVSSWASPLPPGG